MKTSKRPVRACRAATVEVRVSRSCVTSKSAVMAPLLSRSCSLEELRAVAMTVKPRFRASSAMPLPKPLEAAVMNQTGGDMLGLMFRFACLTGLN